MSAAENGATPDLIRKTLEPLLDEHETMADELETLEAQVSEKKAEMRLIEKLLRDAGLLDPKTPKKKPSGGSTAWVSEEMLEHALKSLPSEPFSARELGVAMAVSEATARKALDVLRERREVRLLGKRETPTGHQAIHYSAVS